MADSISGVIDRVTFHNPDTGFAVLRVLIPKRRFPITVVGHLLNMTPGETIEATGIWTQDPSHGEQFKAENLRCVPPSTVEGIEKYLGSGLVKGIGPHLAHKIVEAFGERTLKVIDESPSFLREVKGIGDKRIKRIRESWQEQKHVREILVFLQSHGLGTARAVRIYRTYGDQAVELVRANPYRLATDIWGVGFQTADELADRLGVDRQSPLRARAALRYVLQKLSQEGHVGYPEEAVLFQTAEMTGIPDEIVRAAVEEERHEGEVIREPGGEQPWLYLKQLFLAELNLARCLTKLAAGGAPLAGFAPERELARVEQKLGLQFAPNQCVAIDQATQHPVLVITGGPGTGKTTLVRGILEIFASRHRRVAMCAPTGRAAKRLTETTGREARTIHRLLEFDPGLGSFKRDAANPLEADLVVVDETSMVDVTLMYQLVRSVRQGTSLIFVGDADQLPSVGPGTVLADLIGSGVLPVVRLTEIFRQAGQSHIIRAAHAIRSGELPESGPPGKGDFFLVEADEPATIIDRLLTILTERIPARFGLQATRDVQVLSPMNRSELGTRALNLRLQEAFNPARGQNQVDRFGWTFRVGDKVLQTQNNYQRDVFNGDVGTILEIDEHEREVTVDFDGRGAVYDFGELDELTLAYVLSIHKAQGSEYPAVVIPLHTQHFPMLQRNLLYTGITRGKKLVVLVGSRRALDLAVSRQDTNRRHSALARRLRELAAGSGEEELS